jgi:hypothetical protein
MVRKTLSGMSKFGVRTPLVSNKLNSFCKDPNSNSFGVFVVEVQNDVHYNICFPHQYKAFLTQFFNFSTYFCKIGLWTVEFLKYSTVLGRKQKC